MPDNADLLRAGLLLIRDNGKPLSRVAGSSGSIYVMPTGETVRVRTSRDHILIVLADKDEPSANLNIQGTDYVLIVLLQTPRTPGPVVAYLVPTAVVEEAARSGHVAWQNSNPNTRGNNRTWNVVFRDEAKKSWSGYARKWAEYRLQGSASTTAPLNEVADGAPAGQRRTVKDVVTYSQNLIAEVAGVSPAAVRITIEMT